MSKEFIKKINKWGGKRGGGRCYIPGKFIGKYALIKILEEKDVFNNKKNINLLEFNLKTKTTEDYFKRKEIQKNHIKKLREIRNSP